MSKKYWSLSKQKPDSFEFEGRSGGGGGREVDTEVKPDDDNNGIIAAYERNY